MKNCVISAASSTYAMRIIKELAKGGIPSRQIKLDKSNFQSGCAFGVELDCKYAEKALALLDRGKIPYGVLTKGQIPR